MRKRNVKEEKFRIPENLSVVLGRASVILDASKNDIMAAALSSFISRDYRLKSIHEEYIKERINKEFGENENGN